MAVDVTWAFLQGIGGPELLIILVIILLLFGAKKLPELAKGLGKSMKEFKNATQEVQDDFREAMDSVDTQKPNSNNQEKKESVNAETSSPGNATKSGESSEEDRSKNRNN